MNKEEYLEHNIERLVHTHGADEIMDESKKRRILGALTQQSASGRIKTKSAFYRHRKFAVAAAAVLIPAILLICFLIFPDRRIKIPPELAALTVEQLIELHYEPSKSSFDADIVKAALQQALDKLAAGEVIKLAKNLGDSKSRIQASLVAPPVHPVDDFSGHPRKIFPEVVEGSNLFVHARLGNVTLNVDDIKRALMEKEQFRLLEDYTSKYRTIVQLDVIDALPVGSLRAGKTITVPAVMWEDQLEKIREGSEYFFAMVQDEEEPRLLEYFSGVYPVDYNNPAAIELWRFFSDAQDFLLFGNQPRKVTIDYWISRLGDETFLLALEYMEILPDEFLPAGDLMDAVERRYTDLILQAQQEEAERLSRNDRILFEKAMNLLLRSNDRDSIRRMLDLFDEDAVLVDNSILWQRIHNSRTLLPLIVRLVVASAENNLSDRLLETYKKYKDIPLAIRSSNASYIRDRQIRFAHSLIVEIINQAGIVQGEDIHSMLLKILDEPSEFGLYDAPTFGKIWRILTSSEDYDMRSYLEDFLADPNLSDIGVYPPPDKDYSEYSRFAFERSAFGILQSLPVDDRPTQEELLGWLLLIYERNKDNDSCLHFTVDTVRQILETDDTEFVPVLAEILSTSEPPRNTPSVIAGILPNPNLVPVVRSVLDRQTPGNYDLTDSLLQALYACGEEEEAITKALEELSKPLREDTSRNLYRDINHIDGIILFLGRTQRDYLVPVIEEYTRQEFIEKYRGVFDHLNDGMRMDFCLDQLRQNAIMAFARLGKKSAIPGLRRLYDSRDIRVRLVSALGLYYNGDKTGETLLRRFVEGTHREVPEIEVRWHVDLAGGTAFQSVINSYLRSEFTDELLLEKFTYYLDRADTDIESGFFKDNRLEILEIMVEQLNSSDRATRGFAQEILQKATGQNFGFEPGRYAGQQEDIVQRWREYIASETKTAGLP